MSVRMIRQLLSEKKVSIVSIYSGICYLFYLYFFIIISCVVWAYYGLMRHWKMVLTMHRIISLLPVLMSAPQPVCSNLWALWVGCSNSSSKVSKCYNLSLTVSNKTENKNQLLHHYITIHALANTIFVHQIFLFSSNSTKRSQQPLSIKIIHRSDQTELHLFLPIFLLHSAKLSRLAQELIPIKLDDMQFHQIHLGLHK